MDRKEHVVDVNYFDIDDEITYKTSDVSEILNESDSTIRFWCKSFKDYIKIKREGNIRFFTQENIDDLIYTQNLLRNEKLTIKQAQQRWSKRNNITHNKEIIARDNRQKQEEQLTNEDILLKFEEIKHQFLQDISTNFSNIVTDKLSQSLELHNQSLQQAKTDLQEYIATTVTDTIDKQLNTNKEEIQSTIQQSQQTLSDTINNQFKEHDVELTNSLKHILEERKERLEQEQQSKNKGFFSKLFKK